MTDALTDLMGRTSSPAKPLALVTATSDIAQMLASCVVGTRPPRAGPGAIRPVSGVNGLYDIAVAPHFEPGLIDRILHGIVPRGRAVIAADLRLLPEDIHETGSKPLIRARYEFEWRTLAAAVADAVEAGDKSLLPTPAPVRQSLEP